MNTCPWPIDITSCCNDSGLDLDSPDDAKLAEGVIDQVSQMLSRWSGYSFGGCSTVRPLDPCKSCRNGCCSGDCIVLHNVSAVREVRVHGEVIDEELYSFDPARGVLCAVPPLRWPDRDPRYESTPALEVDVLIGQEPDAWALAVASELACELILDCKGKQCRIPRNASRVSSQGVVIELSRDEILYSLPSVSAWVSAVNPVQATQPAMVMSPEARAQRVHGASRPWSLRGF